MLRPVRWILFDAVGTLIFADPPVAEAYLTAGREFGSRLDAALVAARFRQALQGETAQRADLHRAATSEAAEIARWRRIVASVLEDLPPDAVEQAFQSLWRHFAEPKHWRLFDDVAP